MGCDGGTIPKRKEIVKKKEGQSSQGEKQANLSAKWQFCHLSGLRLKEPIVSCQLGHLYNKDAIIEYLLNSKQPSTSSSTPTSTVCTHIKSLRDVKELKLKEKPDFDRTHQASSGNESFKAQFVCPISGLEMNGKYKFYYLKSCGCVLSERAMREVPDEERCILCSQTYDPLLDLIVLNGDDKEVGELHERIKLRRKSMKLSKKESSKSMTRQEEELLKPTKRCKVR